MRAIAALGWIVGSLAAWFAVAWVVIGELGWRLELIPMTGNGAWIGMAVGFVICVGGFVLWVLVIVRAFGGKLPGTHGRRFREVGACPSCGYDLKPMMVRGEVMKCPECGEEWVSRSSGGELQEPPRHRS